MVELMDERNPEQGTVLFTTLALCVFLSTLSIACLTVAAIQRNVTENQLEGSRLYWLARGVAQETAKEMKGGISLPNPAQIHVPSGEVVLDVIHAGKVCTVRVTAKHDAAAVGVQYTYDSVQHKIIEWQDRMP